MGCSTCGKSVLQTATNIVKGTVNAIFETDKIKAYAEPRLNKCRVCPHSKSVGKLGEVNILQCGICKCFCGIKAKVEDESCPLGLW